MRIAGYFKSVIFNRIPLFLLLVLAAGGCATPSITNTARGVTEQVLLATVSERAVNQMRLDSYREKKAFIEYDFLEPQVDIANVKGVLEMHFASFGITVVKDVSLADIIIQPLCGVLATDDRQFLIGTPELPIPLPNTDLSFAIPEIALFKKVVRRSFARFSLNILRANDRAPQEVIRGSNAEAEFINWVILLVPFTTHSIPMLNNVNEGSTEYELFE